jgi:hypothetical protein
MQTAAIFAVGFGARPVGAWLMGLYADRKGRKAGLTLAVGLMCVGSLIIALCPGHATIGDAAPVILLLARLLQGLSVGGEYGASATYMSEMAGKKRRGFWSSFQYVTLIMGQLVAALVLVILQNTLQGGPGRVGLARPVLRRRGPGRGGVLDPHRHRGERLAPEHQPAIRSAAARWPGWAACCWRRSRPWSRASPRRRSPRRRNTGGGAAGRHLCGPGRAAGLAPSPRRPWRSSA